MTMQCCARPRQIGFTLIELMATVAIVAILGAVAYPNYTTYLQRGRLMDASSKLSDYRVKMEQYYQDNRTFLNTAGTACGVADPATLPGESFDIKCNAGLATATSYTVDVIGIAAKNMSGFTYRLVVDGTGLTKSTVSVPTTYGWKYPSPNNCWTIRKDGSCG